MKKALALAAKIAISVTLLYFAVGRGNLAMLGERLAQVRVEWLLAAIAVLVLQALLVAVRWREIALQSGAQMSLPRAFKILLIAGFFNQTLPSTIGGDAARIWLLAREGAGWSKATYSVLVDRVIGLLALAGIVVVCMPWSFELIRDPVGRAALLVIGLGCIAGPLVFVALGYRHWSLLERWWLTRHLAEAARIATGILRSARTAFVVVALSVVVHLATVAAAWCAAQSAGVALSFVHALLLVLPVILIATVPISIAGWGVRESAMVLAFAYAGLPESDGLLVSVLVGAAMFAVGAIGGITWLASPGSLRFGAKPADEQPMTGAG